MKCLDLFCKAGGTSRGYQMAGFYVVGVDIDPQKNYIGDDFIQADALEILRTLIGGECIIGQSGRRYFLDDFDLISASPPCQGYSDLQKQNKRDYPKLIKPVRKLLIASGKPYVIENVEGAPLLNPILLCGTMFPSLRVIRHRLFETSWFMLSPQCLPHPLVFTHDKRKNHYGQLDEWEVFVQVTGGGNCKADNARDAMGIDWMTKAELNEAIPPVYTEYIGKRMAEMIGESEALPAHPINVSNPY